MLPREILRKIRRIQIRTNRVVNTVLSGEYASVFRGRGMEFDTVREYVPGDEVRSIDWNVTARMGLPFVKQFVEERELTIMLLVDVSASGDFGSRRQFKNEIAAELCAVLAFSAIKNNDRVGLILFTDRVEKFVKPKKGKTHVLRVIRELLYYRPAGTGTDIAAALEFMNKVTTRRAVTFLVSDFLASGYEKPLRIANKRHDMIAVTVRDPRELTMPNVGMISLRDVETGETILVDTTDRTLRASYNRMNTESARALAQRLRSMGVDQISVRTDQPYVEPLLRFFRMREKRFR
ncbi:MAG: DUF58 domain-containing protein [Planctomycetes bacterium]|nr:DUF58 domain-containing protein [Planctomycetota bacterium]